MTEPPEAEADAGVDAAPGVDSAPGVDQTPWRRLDKRMLLVHPLQTLVRALPAMLAIFVARVGSDESDRWELLALPVVIAFGLMRWFTTRYRISHEQIELRRGLLNKQTTTARLDKVRTVDLTAQVHHRVLGLAKVEISTGSAAKERLVLDSLGVDEGRRLRAELLHRADPALASLPSPTGPAYDGVQQLAPDVLADETLLTFNPSWVRYAPFTVTGIASAAAIFGFVSQGYGRFAEEGQVLSSGTRWLSELAIWVDVVGLLVIVSGLAVGAYVLTFWGFHLTRNPAGSLHTRRGLLTKREVSIDHARLRGVALGAPLGLRLARAARLKAVSTGLQGEKGGGSDWLAPPAPSALVTHLAAEIVDDEASVHAPLTPHGAAARRRRLSRALLPALLLSGGVVALALAREWHAWVFTVPALLVVAAVALGLDRYKGLGHLVTASHVVAQEGSLDRQRVALNREGIIGWKIEQSFFQRRAGVATLVATTGAGRQHYDVVDVTIDRAHELLSEIDPELVAQFSVAQLS